MKNTKQVRSLLKHSEPYKIEKELLPNLFLKDDREYWIFLYAFCRRLSDETIGVRLYSSRTQIYRITLNIINNNYTEITKFLEG